MYAIFYILEHEKKEKVVMAIARESTQDSLERGRQTIPKAKLFIS